jgi:hypothetical protein
VPEGPLGPPGGVAALAAPTTVDPRELEMLDASFYKTCKKGLFLRANKKTVTALLRYLDTRQEAALAYNVLFTRYSTRTIPTRSCMFLKYAHKETAYQGPAPPKFVHRKKCA